METRTTKKRVAVLPVFSVQPYRRRIAGYEYEAVLLRDGNRDAVLRWAGDHERVFVSPLGVPMVQQADQRFPVALRHGDYLVRARLTGVEGVVRFTVSRLGLDHRDYRILGFREEEIPLRVAA